MDFLSGDIPPLILAPCASFAFLGIPRLVKNRGMVFVKKEEKDVEKKTDQKSTVKKFDG